MSKFGTNFMKIVGKTKLSCKAHSPEILLVSGLIGVVGAAVMACAATTKIDEVLEEAKEKIDSVHTVLEDKSIPEEKYSEEDGKKDLVIIYANTAVDFVKLYAPSVIIGGLSIAAILASHNKMKKRNVALAAAYATVDKAFKEYRGRVVDRFGDEVEHQIRNNIKAIDVEETIVDDKGKEKKVKKTVVTADPSEYDKIFDSCNPDWTKDAEYNKSHLIAIQRYATELLRANKFLFLNDVYKMLAFEPTVAGQSVGWIYDDENPIGDNVVDFGMFNMEQPNNRFVNGYESCILLHFNVDGPILSLVGDRHLIAAK